MNKYMTYPEIHPVYKTWNQNTDAQMQRFLSMILPYFKMKSIRTIFDIGSATAREALHLAYRYPDAAVYAFEPHPELAEICRKEIIAHNPKIELIECAVSDYDGSGNFYKLSKYESQSSSLPPTGKEYTKDQKIQKIKVSFITLDTWMTKQKIKSVDLVWIDIQGAELRALKGLGDRIYEVKIIYCEASRRGKTYTEQNNLKEIKYFLENRKFKLIDEQPDGHDEVNLTFINTKLKDK